MNYDLKFTPLAISDIESIDIYIKFQLKNTEASKNIISGIFSSASNLIHNPKIGYPIYNDKINTGYRGLNYKNYIIFYRIENSTVIVDRVLHSKTDYLRKLF